VAEAEEEAGFQFDGVKYRMTSLMLAEARAIQRATGLTPIQWEQKIGESDAEAITALIWVARKRNGEPNLRFEDVDGDLATFRPYLHDDPPEDAAPADTEPGKEGPEPGLTPSGPSSEAGSTVSDSTTPAGSGNSSD
jgi:hypothetical protein